MFNPVPGNPDEPRPIKSDHDEITSSHGERQTPPGFTPDPDIEDEAYTYALEGLLKGTKPKEIRKKLVEAGYSSNQANHVVQVATRFQKERQANEGVTQGAGNNGQINMIVGGLVCLLGTVVTLYSFTAASGPGGGRYIIAWGAIVFGAIQFFRGLLQSNQMR